jgi:DNA (cytosine-5)-methyltransferase 1
MKPQFKTLHGNIFETPRWLYNSLDKEFNFTHDLACLRENCKAPKGLYDGEVNSLEQDWHKLDGWLWLNPPYSPLKPWIEKCQKESRLGAKIVALVPPHISTRYFSKTLPTEIRFILGRVPFYKDGVEMRGNTSDSVILVYGGPPAISKISYVERDSLRANAKAPA